MRVFVDSSAFYAILDANDENHVSAKELWAYLVEGRTKLVTSNYVLAETIALVRHRLGMQAVRTLQEDMLPVVQVEWVDEVLHRAGVAAVLAAARRGLSFLDCVSFEVMREMGMRTAFAFDHHFEEQGFERIPLRIQAP